MAVSLSNEQERELGGLLFSGVQVANPMQALRAAEWRNRLARVGMPVPFWVVHDLGLLFLGPPDQLAARAGLAQSGMPPQVLKAHATWLSLLEEISHTEMIERARAWKLRDDLVAVVLLRVLAPVYERFVGPGRRPIGVALPLDPRCTRSSARGCRPRSARSIASPTRSSSFTSQASACAW